MAEISDVACRVLVEQAETAGFSFIWAACLMVNIDPRSRNSDLSNEEKRNVADSLKLMREFVKSKRPDLLNKIPEQDLADYKDRLESHKREMTEWRNSRNVLQEFGFQKPKPPTEPKDEYGHLTFKDFEESAGHLGFTPKILGVIKAHTSDKISRIEAKLLKYFNEKGGKLPSDLASRVNAILETLEIDKIDKQKIPDNTKVDILKKLQDNYPELKFTESTLEKAWEAASRVDLISSIKKSVSTHRGKW